MALSPPNFHPLTQWCVYTDFYTDKTATGNYTKLNWTRRFTTLDWLVEAVILLITEQERVTKINGLLKTDGLFLFFPKEDKTKNLHLQTGGKEGLLSTPNK